MKRLFPRLMGLVVMLGLSMTAFAQADPQITVNSSQFIYQGVGTGIYYGSVGSTPTNFVCDDFTDEIIPGETWQAAVYNLESVFTGSPPVLFNGITPGHDATTWTQAYAEVAWLAEQIFTNTNQSTGDSLQYAIWYIMDHPTISDPGSGATDAANALSWYNHLSASCQEDPVACGALANLVIYVPISWTGSGQPQELLGTPTPEPLTMLLMGTFLSLVGFGLGKKKLFS